MSFVITGRWHALHTTPQLKLCLHLESAFNVPLTAWPKYSYCQLSCGGAARSADAEADEGASKPASPDCRCKSAVKLVWMLGVTPGLTHSSHGEVHKMPW